MARKFYRRATASSIASEQAWEWESMKVEPSAPEEEAEEGSAGGLKEQLSFSCQESVFPSWSATM
ncbi:unnamed protein product [Nippostrongylus brasiliensis]|uniref:Uncharacterized protein n=1 Tax=Nippostrongylus brasiliensis TaxID=27835 RepID=A0A0N4XN35_NIPBR|nr:unnamed protein product [Nippostrongylus brasiliensis]